MDTAPSKREYYPRRYWHPQLQENLVQSLLPLLAHCFAPMKPHPVGASADFPSLHMIDLHMPESANITAE